MPLDIDSALGPLPEALKLRAKRTELLASNLANADTPNFKARDIDFQTALNQARSDHTPLVRTQAAHLPATQTLAGDTPLQYRLPLAPSIDGNTVDSQLEQAAFSENAVMYQATLSFLGGRVKGLMTAIKGE